MTSATQGVFEALTGLAIGYAADPVKLVDEKWRQRDNAPRHRRPLSEFVFGGTFGQAARLG